MTSFRHLSITIALMAAAISVEDSDKLSDAVDVIVSNRMPETHKVSEETEALDAERAKSAIACKGTSRGGRGMLPTHQVWRPSRMGWIAGSHE